MAACPRLLSQRSQQPFPFLFGGLSLRQQRHTLATNHCVRFPFLMGRAFIAADSGLD